MVLTNSISEFSSFKDIDAQVFTEGEEVYRKIFESYKNNYTKLMDSGLYEHLVNKNLLIPHKEVEKTENCIIIKPEKIFISYPWEWCFSQIKDAALATLEIQKIALEYNMTLKDANFFNIQFKDNKPVLIDTTSFEEYQEGELWCAYRQFCENFLTVLLLMSKVDIRLKNLITTNLDGIPLDLTSKLLPIKTRFNPGIFMHIHMHSKFQNKYSESRKKISAQRISKEQLKIFIDNLYNVTNEIKPPLSETEWGEYYTFTNYSDESFEKKKELIKSFCTELNPESVIDFGANNGMFSRIIRNNGSKMVYSLDIDESAVEYNYQQAKQNNERNIIPLVYDIFNPSPNVGFENKERTDLRTRTGRVNLVLALALIHHLRITGNIPFEKQAEFFSSYGKYLIIEYVCKEDSKVQQMLLNRKDVFNDYSPESFERSFAKYYKILRKEKIQDTQRVLYLMECLSNEF